MKTKLLKRWRKVAKDTIVCGFLPYEHVYVFGTQVKTRKGKQVTWETSRTEFYAEKINSNDREGLLSALFRRREMFIRTSLLTPALWKMKDRVRKLKI